MRPRTTYEMRHISNTTALSELGPYLSIRAMIICPSVPRALKRPPAAQDAEGAGVIISRREASINTDDAVREAALLL